MAELDDKTLQNLNQRMSELDKTVKSASEGTSYLAKNLKSLGQSLSGSGVNSAIKSIADLEKAAKRTRDELTKSARTAPKSVAEEIRKMRDEYNKLIRSIRVAQNKTLNAATTSIASSIPSTPGSLARGATMNAKASKDAEKASKKQRKEMEKMAVEASKIAKYTAAAFSIGAIKGFLSQMIQVTGEFEMQQVALRNIIKSENKSNEIWKKTLNLALNSPLTAMQLTKYTKQLAAFRIETNKIYDTTKMLADVSTGLGVDMERLILAYGHTKSSGFLRGMYARQFATAGVNIYGELAQYYSDMEGKEVTFKDVYERISKKLVAFADVEAVFKKLTSEGGTFYRMQEKLSDTVQGQVNKLKDAWQQLLNQMGSAKKGTMRDIVDILLKVITDFRIFVGLIRTGAVGLLAHQLANVAIALSGVSKKFMIASASASKFANGLKGLFTSMRGGLAQMGIAAVAMAITAMISAYNEWQQQLEQIDNRTTDYRKQADAVKNLKEQIDENNKAIKGEEGATKDATAAKRDNKRILEQLKAEYPEQVSGIEAQTNGYIELSNALDDVIERLKRKQRYSRMEATTGGVWNDTLGENIGDLQREFNADERAVDKAVQAMENSITKTEETIENSNFSSEYKDFLRGRIDTYKQMIKIAEENEDDVEYVLDEWSKFNKKMVNVDGSNRYFLVGNIVDPVGIRGGYSFYERVVNSEQADRAKVIKDLQTYTQKTEQWLKNDLQNIDDYKDEIAQYESKGGVFGWLAKNAERVEKDIKEGKIPDVLGAFREHFRTDLGVTSKAMETYINKALNNLILHTKNSLAGRSYLFDFFVSPLSTEKENKPLGDDDGNKKAKKSINSLVELLKKMNTEYEKLKENAYGAAMSARVVREEYKEAFAEIFGSTSGKYNLKDENGKVIGKTLIDWEAVDTTNKAGVARAIESLIKEMDTNNLWGQYQRDARKQVEKILSEMKVEMGIAVEVHKREDFDRKMEELFKDYELSVEMKELKIPENVAESMFGFTYKTLGDLQAEMNKFYEEQQNNGLLDTKAWEAYKKYADKIDAEIMKERKERAKQYSKFMEKEISDRAKLEKEYYDNIAMISSESAFTDKQKSNIIQQVTDDFQKALAKLDWETFKSSDFYVEMMDDLTNMPVKYMEVMLKEVNKVIENADILSPRALKEALRARREVREAILSEASLGGIFRETIGAFRAYRANGYTGDEANQEAERRLGMTPGATTVAGLIKERKLLREAVSIRSEYIAQKEEEIRLADEQIARLQSYWEAYNKFQDSEKGLGVIGVYGTDETSLENVRADIAEQEQVIQDLKAEYDALSDDDKKKLLDEYNEEIRVHEQMITVLKNEETAIDSYVRAKGAMESAEGRLTSADRDESGNVLQVSPLQAERNKLQLGKEDMEKAQLGDKEALKNLKRFTDAWNELSNNVNNAKEKLKSLGSATYDMLESLGMETNLVTDAWKNFADTLMDTITGALTMIPQLVAGFVSAGVSINAAMGIVGLIAEAIQLVITLITALAKLEDSYHLQAIEDSKKRVDELSKSFNKLNDVIDKTMSSAEYFTVYVGEVENLNEQLEEANLQLEEAAQIKDKSDREEATKNAKDNIDEIQKQLEDAANDLQDTFGGIARKDFRSWAEEFVDAWTDAFLETGDGYDALMDTFEDKLLETFKKQALMRGLAKIMESLETVINSTVGDDSIIDDAELEYIREQMEIAARNGDVYLRKMAEIYDLGATGQLSGLSAGISGMTEETAEVLEGYWNSVRMYTAETNQNVAIIADAFSNPDSTNPMLGQLRLIAEQATQIRTLLDSVTKSAGHSKGGAGIKVFMS